MATNKKAAKKKAASKKKAAAKKGAAKKRKSTPAKVIVKKQPPIRIIVDVVVRNKATNTSLSFITRGVSATNPDLVSDVTSLAKTDSEVEKDVKEYILTNSPKTDLTIEDLTDGITLKENLDYQSDDYDTLQIDLNGYVNSQKADQHVTYSEVVNNKTVGSMVKMVKEKLK